MDEAIIAETILNMATERGADKSICPSDVARMLLPTDWRKHMDKVCAEALKLQAKGSVTITQKGQPIDPHHINGPVRIKISR